MVNLSLDFFRLGGNRNHTVSAKQYYFPRLPEHVVDDSVSPRKASAGESEIGSRLIEADSRMNVELDILAEEEHEATVKVVLRLCNQSPAGEKPY